MKQIILNHLYPFLDAPSFWLRHFFLHDLEISSAGTFQESPGKTTEVYFSANCIKPNKTLILNSTIYKVVYDCEIFKAWGFKYLNIYFKSIFSAYFV